MSDDSPIGPSNAHARYRVTYQDLAGEIKTYTRTPPPKIHDLLPTDEVTLTRKKNDDFRKGDEAVVKHINPRHPNVLQVEAGGKTTFIDSYDLALSKAQAPRALGDEATERIQDNRYLLWP